MANYYVAKNGNNGWDGSEENPWLTINYAETQVGSNDTVYIKAGTYSDGRITFSGVHSSGNECRFRAYASDTVIITTRMLVSGDWYIFDDLEFVTSNSSSYTEIEVSGDNNVFNNMYSHDYTGSRWEGGVYLINPASYNTFNNLVLVDGGVVYVPGIQQSTPTGNLFSGGSISYTNGTGIRFGGEGNTVEDMEIHDCGYGNDPGAGADDCDGIVTHGDNHTFRNLKIYHIFRKIGSMHTDAIQWWDYAGNIVIEGCQFGSATPGGVSSDQGHIQMNGEYANMKIINNVFLGTGGFYTFNHDAPNTFDADNCVINNNVFRGLERPRYDNYNQRYWEMKNNVMYWDGPDWEAGAGWDIDYNIYVDSNESPWEGDNSLEQVSDAGFINDSLSAGNDYGLDGDYHLVAGAECIDRAYSNAATTLDPDGNPRYDDPLVTNNGGGTYDYYDIGVYEYQGVGGGQIETLAGSAAGSSTAGVLAMVSIRELPGSSSGGSTASAYVHVAGTQEVSGSANGGSSASASVLVPGIQELAGQTDGGSTVSATVLLGGEVTIGGQSDGGSTAGASIIIDNGGELSATLLADTYIRADGPTINYGSDVDLRVYRDVTNDWCNAILLRFDFTAIPGGQKIETALLSLWCHDDPAAGQILYARHLESVGQAWTEGGATWNTYDGVNSWDSGAFSDSDIPSANQGSDTSTGVDGHWFDFSIVNLIIHAYENHAKILEVVVTTDEDSENRINFDSDEDPGDNAPKLEIAYSSSFKNLAGQSDGSSTVGCNLTKESVLYRYPESDDPETDGTFAYVPSSPETVWDKVDDPWEFFDDDSTYVIHQSNETNYTADSTAFAVPDGVTISNLRIVVRHKKIGSGAASIETSIKVGGNWYDTDITNPTQDVWSDTNTDYPNNPDTSQPWTVDQINGIGANALDTFGWYVTDADPDVYVTNVALRVSYFGEVKTLAGSSDGVATVNGAVSPIRGLAGTTDGSSTVIADLATILVNLAGISNGVSTVTAIPVLTIALVGASDGLSTAGAVIKRTSRMIVASDGVATVTIVLKRIREITGASDSSTSTTGAVTNILKEVAGVSSGTSTAGALLGAIEKLAGATNGVATVGALLDVSKYIDGATDGLSTTTATVKVTKGLVGISVGAGVVSNIPLEILSKLAGISEGTSTVTTLVKITKKFVGQSDGNSTAAIVGIKCALDISGASDGTATVGASLTTGQEELLAGQSDGLSTVAGPLDITKPFIGTSDGIATASVTLDVTSKLDGQTNGIATVGSALNILKPLACSSDGTSTVSATVRELQDLAGTTDGLSTAGSVLEITKKLIGLAVGTSTVTGSILKTRSVAGSASGSSTTNVIVKVSKKLAGASNGSSTAGASITEATLVAGIATGSSTVAATIKVKRELAGTANGTSNASATVSERTWLAGSSVGGSTVTAPVKVTKKFDGITNGVALLTAFLDVTKEVAGTTNGISTALGNVMITRGVIGVTAGSSTAIALAKILKTLSSLSAGTSTAQIDVGILTPFTGSTDGIATVGALAKILKKIAGQSIGLSQVDNVLLKVDKEHAGTSVGTSTTNGLVKVLSKLVGSSTGTCTVSATLEERTNLSGTSSGTSLVSSSLKVSKLIAGVSNGSSTTTAVLLESTDLGGSTNGVSTVGAGLKVEKKFIGATAGGSTATASWIEETLLVCAASGSSTTTASIVCTRGLIGQSNGLSTVQAAWQERTLLQGSTAGGSTVTAIPMLKIVRTVDGLAAGQSTASGTFYVLFVLSGVTNGTCTITIDNLAIGTTFASAIACTSTATLDLGKTRYHQLGYVVCFRVRARGRMVVIRPK